MGLDNIEGSSIEDLYISANGNLSVCEVQSVCDYLANPSGSIVIHNNAQGCNSQEEVLDSCGSAGVDEKYLIDALKIFPNPASNILTIKTDNQTIDENRIYNLTGQIILKQRPSGNQIDVSALPTGLYVIECVIDNRLIRQKLMVQR